MVEWYKSETFWVGIALIVLPILEQVRGSGVLEEHPAVASLVGLAIIVLRRRTSKPIRLPFERKKK